MQAQKSTRRNRKDSQSRDFTCACGKSYLSYAAAYTHVKHKHHLEESFLKNIGKPPRQKQPRGRRKREKPIQVGSDVEQLSLFEESTLKMYELMGEKFEKMILEANTYRNNQEVEEECRALSDNLKYDLKGELGREDKKFIESFCRHFSSQITARVRICVSELQDLPQQRQQNSFQVKKKMQFLDSFDLWQGKNQANEIIYQTYHKWKGGHAHHSDQ